MILGKKYGYLNPKRDAKWIEWEDGVELLIAPSNNLAYNKFMVKNMSDESINLMMKGMTAAEANPDADADVINDLITKEVEQDIKDGSVDFRSLLASLDSVKWAVAETILLDWKGIQDELEDGSIVDVEYSVKKAHEYLEGYDGLFRFVQDEANKIAKAKEAIQEDIKKN